MPIVPATPVSRSRQQILGAPARLGPLPDAGGVGRAIGGAISAIGDVGVQITEHMERLKTEADENEAVLAESQYLDHMTAAHYDGPSAFLNRKGNAARNSFSDGRRFATTDLEEIANSLSPGASKLFKRAANKIRANYGTELIKWVGSQTEQARVEALGASQASLQEAYVKSRDPEAREEIGVALDAVLDQQTVGSTPESRQITKDFKDGKITGTAAVNALNRGDIEDAKTILASDRGKHMEESTRIKVQNGIDESEHLTAVQGAVQEALVRFPDPVQAAQAEAWIRRNSSGGVQADSLTNIRKTRSAEATAETAQRKAENESAHSIIDDVKEQERRGEPPMDVKSKIAMGQQIASRIQDHTKRASFQRRWDDEVVNGFSAVTNRSHFVALDLMSWQDMQGVDLREFTLDRKDYGILLRKQKTPGPQHTSDTQRINNALRDIGEKRDSDKGKNFAANFYSDRQVFEDEHGPMSQEQQSQLVRSLKESTKDIEEPFFWMGFDEPGLSFSDIEKQFADMPQQQVIDFTESLTRTLRRPPEKWEVVSAIRKFNNEQALGFGRISEPEAAPETEPSPAATEAQKRTSTLRGVGAVQGLLRGSP